MGRLIGFLALVAALLAVVVGLVLALGGSPGTPPAVPGIPASAAGGAAVGVTGPDASDDPLRARVEAPVGSDPDRASLLAEESASSGRLAGRVLDSTGQPRAGVRVWVGDARQPVAQWVPEHAGVTDRAGRFAVRGTKDRLVLRAAGHGVVAIPLGEPKGLERAREFGDLRLAVGGTVAGRLAAPAGLPPACVVRLVPLNTVESLPAPTEGVLREVPVAADGSFRFEQVALGLHRVLPVAAGKPLPVRRRTLQVLGGRTVDAGSLEIAALRDVSGLVLGPVGQPLPGARVEVTAPGFGLDARRTVSSDEAGRFELRDLPAGVELVGEVTAVSFADVKLEAERFVGEQPLVVRMRQGLRLRGQVVAADGSGPVTRFTVLAARERQLEAPAGGPFGSEWGGGGASGRPVPLRLGAWGESCDDPDGRFELAGLDAGWSYVVYVEAPGFVTRGSDPRVPSAHGGAFRVALERGVQLGGRVVALPGSVPVAGAGLRVAEVSASGRGSLQSVGETDAEGRFVLPVLPAARYVFEVAHPEHHASTEFAVEATESRDDLRFEVPQPAWIVGQVGGFDPQSSAELQVCAYDGGNEMEFAEVDGSGRFRIGPLPPGGYALRCFDVPMQTFFALERALFDRRESGAFQQDLTLAAGEELEVELEPDRYPLGSVAGRITENGGASIGTVVEVSTLGLRILTDADGRFTLPDFPAGVWQLEVSLAGRNGPRLRADVTVEAGQRTLRDLRLATGTLRGRLVGEAWGSGVAMAVWSAAPEPESRLRWQPVTFRIEGRRFEIPRVLAGPGNLVVRLPSGGPRVFEVDVPAGGGGAELEIRAD